MSEIALLLNQIVVTAMELPNTVIMKDFYYLMKASKINSKLSAKVSKMS